MTSVLRLAQSTLCLSTLLLAAGCESVSTAVFPDAPQTPQASALPPSIVAAPQAGTTQFLPVAITPGAPTSSAAGGKIAETRNKLVALQGRLSGRNVSLATIRQGWTQDVATYRLQKNMLLRPAPDSDTRKAAASGDAALKRLAQFASRLQGEVDGFAQGNGEANALMLALQDVTAEDPNDAGQLNRLRGEITQTSTALDSLVNALTSEAAQSSAFVAKERASLAALMPAASPPPSLRAAENATPATTPAEGQPITPPSTAPRAPLGTRPAFVTIKFDRPAVTYREALAAALKQALKRRPDAAFDVVGVTDNEAVDLVKVRAEDVSRTMMELGVPASRIGLDAQRSTAVKHDEVRIFVR